MISKGRNILVATLVFLLSFASLSSNVYAVTFTDVPENHWARSFIEDLAREGIISGQAPGIFNPDANITRAEFFTLTNNIFGFEDEVDVYFHDVSSDAWFYLQIRRAVAAGYLQGFEDGSARPNNNITRAEVAVLVNNILDLPAAAYNNFVDGYAIPAWAEAAINAVAAAEIVRGYPDGTFQPTWHITRAESAALFYSIRNLVDDEDYDDTLIISSNYGPASGRETITTDVRIVNPLTLRNVLIEGDLFIDESIGNGLVTLDNVIVRGNVQVDSRNIILEGEFDYVHLNASNTTMRLRNTVGLIRNFHVHSGAAGSNITIDANTEVINAFIDAPVRIGGNGIIRTAMITSDGVVLLNPNIIRSIASGSRIPSEIIGLGPVGPGGTDQQPWPWQPPIDRPVTADELARIGVADVIVANFGVATTATVRFLPGEMRFINDVTMPDVAGLRITSRLDRADDRVVITFISTTVGGSSPTEDQVRRLVANYLNAGIDRMTVYDIIHTTGNDAPNIHFGGEIGDIVNIFFRSAAFLDDVTITVEDYEIANWEFPHQNLIRGFVTALADRGLDRAEVTLVYYVTGGRPIPFTFHIERENIRP